MTSFSPEGMKPMSIFCSPATNTMSSDAPVSGADADKGAGGDVIRAGCSFGDGNWVASDEMGVDKAVGS